MTIKFDLSRVLTDPSFIDELVQNKDQLYSFNSGGKEHKMEARWMLPNMILLAPLIKRQMPIEDRHLIINQDITKKNIQSVHTQAFEDLLRHGSDPVPEILKELVISINVLYNVICTHLGAYQRSFDMFSYTETLMQPEIAAVSHVNLEPEIKMRAIDRAEDKLGTATKELINVLSDNDLKDRSILYPFVRLGIASEQQVPQVVLAAGTRTDVNDMMIMRPIQSSYAGGLRDIYELAIDSLSAKKSLYYNASGLGDSQYANRKEQLMTSTLHRIHPGDCGTTVTVDFELLPINASHCVGKFIVDKGRMVELTRESIPTYMGRVVKLRSPIVCRHVDGCCHACGGRMLQYILPNTAIGIASTVELMGPTAQLILSSKHVSRTASIVYALSPTLRTYLRTTRNEIYLHKEADPKKLVIGVPFSNASRISDLQYVENTQAINDQHFSSISEICFADPKTGEWLMPLSNAMDQDGNIPYFSVELLTYVKENPDMLQITQDGVWINLKSFDSSKPLMKCIVANASMPRFSKQIRTLFSDKIESYTSAVEVLRDFTNIVYSKVHPNIFHLEIIIRASMIRSGRDARIPVVTDPHNVRFGSLSSIIRQRSIGSQLAFERIGEYLSDPRTYTHPKIPGIFDAFAGMGIPPSDGWGQ